MQAVKPQLGTSTTVPAEAATAGICEGPGRAQFNEAGLASVPLGLNDDGRPTLARLRHAREPTRWEAKTARLLFLTCRRLYGVCSILLRKGSSGVRRAM